MLSITPNHIVEAIIDLAPAVPASVFYVTGAGGSLLNTLLTSPGISAFFLECRVPYSAEALRSCIATPDPNAACCSSEAAKALARKALQRCSELALAKSVHGSSTTLPAHLIGVGSSSALVTSRMRRGDNRIYVTVVTSNGIEVNCSLVLEKQKRRRHEEDAVVEALVLRAYVEALAALKLTTDDASTQLVSNAETLLQSLVLENKPLFETTLPLTSYNELLHSVVDHVVRGHFSHGVYCPVSNSIFPEPRMQEVVQLLCTGQINLQTDRAWVSLPRLLLLSGSFNPVHNGHVAMMAHAAQNITDALCVFELSCVNADKGTISADEVCRRLQQFQFSSSTPSTSSLSLLHKSKTLVLVTREPLFPQKVALLGTPATIIMGADTLDRVLDPAYQSPSSAETVAQAILEMYRQGVRFYIFGRERAAFRKHLMYEESFLLGSSVLSKHTEVTGMLPRLISDGMFVEVEDFRLDISSTDLRQKQQCI